MFSCYPEIFPYSSSDPSVCYQKQHQVRISTPPAVFLHQLPLSQHSLSLHTVTTFSSLHQIPSVLSIQLPHPCPHPSGLCLHLQFISTEENTDPALDALFTKRDDSFSLVVAGGWCQVFTRSKRTAEASSRHCEDTIGFPKRDILTRLNCIS